MILHEDREVFTDLMEETAEIIGLPQIFVEKDYWVTKSLQHLATSEYMPNVVFKGGTSLSKAYKITNRFSEDIDLAVLLPNNTGDAKRKKLFKNIETIVATGLNPLPGDERESKGSKFRRTVHQYPRVIEDENFGHASSELLIELNSFTLPEPYAKHQLSSLIAEVLIEKKKNNLVTKYALDNFSINVLSVERTLTEKILCIVKDSYCNDPVNALSKHIRHLYDICLILKQKKYQDFVYSNNFKPLITKCIEDEKSSNPLLTQCLDAPLFNAPLFTKFDTWRNHLKKVYEGDFTSFVYGQLPRIDEIEGSLMSLKKHFK